MKELLLGSNYGQLTENIFQPYSVCKDRDFIDLFLRTDLKSMFNLRNIGSLAYGGFLNSDSKEESRIKKKCEQKWNNRNYDQWKRNQIFGPNVRNCVWTENLNVGLGIGERLWEQAGVHRYINTEDVFYIGQKLDGHTYHRRRGTDHQFFHTRPGDRSIENKRFLYDSTRQSN